MGIDKVENGPGIENGVVAKAVAIVPGICLSQPLFHLVAAHERGEFILGNAEFISKGTFQDGVSTQVIEIRKDTFLGHPQDTSEYALEDVRIVFEYGREQAGIRAIISS